MNTAALNLEVRNANSSTTRHSMTQVGCLIKWYFLTESHSGKV